MVRTSPSYQGFFITFEGGEGSGKTTLLEKIAAHLLSLKYDVVKTRAPGGTELGKSLRYLLLHQEKIALAEQAELFLFLADRAQHVKEIILPALQQGKIVLCDRFNDSTIAYQGAARGYELSWVSQLCSFATGHLVPQMTLYLDVPVSVGLKRANAAIVKEGKAAYDRVEKEDVIFHEKVRTSYLALVKQFPERIHMIDSLQSIDEVFHQALTSVLSLLGDHAP